MRAHHVVIGQHVDPIKATCARQLRHNMTAEEQFLWNCLRGNKLAGLHFRRQQVIDGFIVDFYCHAAGLVIEVDGGVHSDRTAYDVERDTVLAGRGLKIMRVPNSMVRNDLEGVLQRIAEACKPNPQPPSLRGKGEPEGLTAHPRGKGARGPGGPGTRDQRPGTRDQGPLAPLSS